MRTLSQSLAIQNLKADHELSSTRWGCTTRKYKALVVGVVVEQERRTKTPHWLGRRAATGAAAATAATSERASERASRKGRMQTRSCCCDEKLRKWKNKSKLGVCYIPPPPSLPPSHPPKLLLLLRPTGLASHF
jgi:hypothetical protein